jgi:hypothetical protein
MALSRKNYEAVAAIVAGDALIPPIVDGWDRGYETAREELAKSLASYFAQDNERFDRARFLAACGVAS